MCLDVGEKAEGLSSILEENSRMCQSWARWSVTDLVDEGVEFRVYSFDHKQTSGDLKQGE